MKLFKHPIYFLLLVLLNLFIIGCGDPAPNKPPVINLVIESKQALPGQLLQFSATITDPENDEVTVKWAATSGEFSLEYGLSTEWTASDTPQTVVITVLATDEKEATDEKAFTINIYNNPPNITSFSAESDHLLLGNTTTLTANASDSESDFFTYNFYCLENVGSFEHDKPTDAVALWTAPEGIEQYCHIICEATDIYSDTSRDTIAILVYSDYGTIWSVDSGNKKVKKHTSSGDLVFTVEQEFSKPVAVVTNIDEFYGCFVADYEAGTVTKLSAEGEVMRTFENFVHPYALAVHGSTRQLWVMDIGNNTITIINGFTDQVMDTIRGLNAPRDIQINQITGDVWIADTGNDRVVKVTVDAYPDSITILNSEIYESYFNAPTRFSFIDAVGAPIYITDQDDNQIERLTYNAGQARYIRDVPVQNLTRPLDVAVTSAGRVWIINDGGRIDYFAESDPNNLSILETVGFNDPHWIRADDINGTIWIAYNGSNLLVEVNQTGTITTNVPSFVFIEDFQINQ